MVELRIIQRWKQHLYYIHLRESCINVSYVRAVMPETHTLEETIGAIARNLKTKIIAQTIGGASVPHKEGEES